ncbi:GNAT family N-acetyltransferase [Clostridium diolis]|uniref:GNAT family N-acetyltransferase n=1 Tax=Clostridium diolis TaxID=223919 RepID=UPI003AF6C728
MEIKFINEMDYKIWNEFCINNSYATFFHTSYAMEYFKECSFNIKAQQKSFMIYENNNLIACMPVFLETIDNENNLSYGGGQLLSPLITETLNKAGKRKVMKIILQKLDEIAYENNVNKISFYIPYLSNKYINSLVKYNYFLQYGYVDTSGLTCILDLEPTEEEIFKKFTKGHKADINKSKKYLELEIINNEDVSEKKIDDFMRYYFKIAGKHTRPQNTFNNICKWVKEEKGVLFKAIYNNNVCGYSFYSYYKDTAYYYMACKDNNLNNLKISHYLQWEAIKYLKNQGIKFLELGTQDFEDTLYNFPSEKDINISKFKRGFGGFIMPVYKAEKFYSSKSLKKCYEERIEKYISRNF